MTMANPAFEDVFPIVIYSKMGIFQTQMDTNGESTGHPANILGVSQFPVCQTIKISKGSLGGIDRFLLWLKVALGYSERKKNKTQRNQPKNRRFMTSM